VNDSFVEFVFVGDVGMAGHSHAANIAVRKGKQDAARARVFSKMARYIMIAARNGGGDPDTNLRLRYAIDKARSVSMPKDNIERAVKKGTGELEGVSYEEVTYEGTAHGVAIMVETLTDNRNRTASEIRSMFEKLGGKFGTPGCVAHMFDSKGVITIDVKAFPAEDKVMEAVMEAGGDDFNTEGDVYVVLTDPTKLTDVAESLKTAGYVPTSAELKKLPKLMTELDVDTGKKVVRILDAFEDNDDVQNVWSTATLTDEMFA
jgi:YebC/PmpR family DNA-binding regulatory protein